MSAPSESSTTSVLYIVALVPASSARFATMARPAPRAAQLSVTTVAADANAPVASSQGTARALAFTAGIVSVYPPCTHADAAYDEKPVSPYSGKTMSAAPSRAAVCACSA